MALSLLRASCLLATMKKASTTGSWVGSSSAELSLETIALMTHGLLSILWKLKKLRPQDNVVSHPTVCLKHKSIKKTLHELWVVFCGLSAVNEATMFLWLVAFLQLSLHTILPGLKRKTHGVYAATCLPLSGYKRFCVCVAWALHCFCEASTRNA
jgi:hypothetical protein